MSHPSLIEVPVVCTLSAARRLTPFHWVLLEALETFPAGSRPSIERLAERLRVGERAFLDEAWRELAGFRAVDADGFSSARRGVAGDMALARGWFPAGPSTLERRPVFFRRDDGEPVPLANVELISGPLLSAIPTWGRAMAAEAWGAAVETVHPAERGPVGLRVLAAEPDWKSAREVRVRQALGNRGS